MRWKDLQKCAPIRHLAAGRHRCRQASRRSAHQEQIQGQDDGRTLVSAQRQLSNNDSAWFAHKLRNKLVHEQYTSLKEADVKDALVGFRQALKDLGASEMIDAAVRKQYSATIGIECHVQLKTATKLFSAVGNDAREAPPNTLVSHIDFGLPGALPVLNEEAVHLGAKAPASPWVRCRRSSASSTANTTFILTCRWATR
jgi:hypothetical protein